MTLGFSWWVWSAIFLRGGTLLPLVETFIQRPPNITGFMPDAMWMSTPELIKLFGFRPETHTVQTSDGYLLEIHRILSGASRLGNGQPHRTPLLVGHGLASNSEQWVLRHDNMNLVVRLVEEGFDVWLSNYRGSFYGRRHLTLNPKSRKFWDFSWHENGVYDQPALIDYVLKETGHESLLTLGHSMSSTVQLVMLMERPEYARKVRANMLLAPPAFFTQPSGALRVWGELFKGFPKFKTAFSTLIVNDLMALVEQPAFTYCYLRTARKRPLPFCPAIFDLVGGHSRLPKDPDLTRVLMSHYPAGSSIRQFMHYGQSVYEGGDFRKYDFGPDKNRQLYGLPEPPAYNLSALDSPVYIYYGLTDNLVNYKDAEKLGENIPSVSLKRLYQVPAPIFNHVDFMIGEMGLTHFSRQLIDDLNKYV